MFAAMFVEYWEARNAGYTRYADILWGKIHEMVKICLDFHGWLGYVIVAMDDCGCSIAHNGIVSQWHFASEVPEQDMEIALAFDDSIPF